MIGRLAITTAEAWVPACRLRPSISPAKRKRSAIFGFASIISRKRGSAFSASSTVILRSAGIILAIRSTSAYGISRTLPTSRTAPRGFHVPNVMSWATFSSPYLRWT